MEDFLNDRPFIISAATVVMLVALRIAIGWHFFQEGLEHKNNPNWSREVEGFLNQAKGPLAPLYAGQTPSFHGFSQQLLGPYGVHALVDATLNAQQEAAGKEIAKKDDDPAKPENSKVYGDWYSAVVRDWKGNADATANFYHFTDEQIQANNALEQQYAGRLAEILAGYEPDIKLYREEVAKNQDLASMPGTAEIPNRSARLAKRSANPTGEPGITPGSSPSDWRADVAALEAEYQRALRGIATDDQRKLGSSTVASTTFDKINSGVVWLLMIAGGCLLIGLFTRLSAIALAIFLLSIIASQPPWIAGTIPTYDQVV
ncbi:MAG TPA: DoxX family protein, partial [Pirellulales bacterium]